MAIQARCPKCASVVRAGDKYAGRQVKCPKCAGTITLPASTAAADASPSTSQAAAAGPAPAATGVPGPDATGPAPATPVLEPAGASPADLPLVRVDDEGGHWRQVVSKSGKPRQARGRSSAGWRWMAIAAVCVAAVGATVFLITRQSDEPVASGDPVAARSSSPRQAAEQDGDEPRSPIADSSDPDRRATDEDSALARRDEPMPAADGPVEQELQPQPQPAAETREPMPAPRVISRSDNPESAEPAQPEEPRPESPGNTIDPVRAPDSVAATGDPAAPAENLPPAEVLEKHGVRVVGDQATLADESIPKLRSALKEAGRLRVTLSRAGDHFAGLERQMRQATRQHGILSAALAEVNATRPGDVTTNNRLVGQLNAIAAGVEQLEGAIEASRSKLAQAREAYVQHLLETRKIVESVEQTYETRQADPQLSAALAQLSQEGGTELSLAPSGGFARDVRDLEALERQVLSDAVPGRLESGNLFVSVVINGKHTVEMVVDSGASLISVPHSMAVEWGVEPKESDPVSQFQIADGSTITGRIVTVPSVRVGKFTAKNVEVAVLGPEARNATPLLGMTFLGKFEFKIDSDRRQLILSGVETGDEATRTR